MHCYNIYLQIFIIIIRSEIQVLTFLKIVLVYLFFFYLNHSCSMRIIKDNW